MKPTKSKLQSILNLALKLVIVVLLALGVVAFFEYDLDYYFSLQTLKENRDTLRIFTQDHYWQAALIFVGCYFLQTTFSLPGGAIMTLAGGFLFGSVIGTLLVNVGATLGATCAFLAARYILRDWVENKFGNRIAAIQEGFATNGFNYLLFLRFIPLFPFFVVNLVSGLTRINIISYIAATCVGILPGSFVFAYAGQQLGSIDSLEEILSPPVLQAFALLGLLALVPIMYQKFKAKKAKRGSRS